MARSGEAALIVDRPSRLRILLVLAALAASAACAGRRFTPSSEPAGAEMGVYRATYEATTGKTHEFRLLLYAALPDRVHGEVLSPVGTTELIFDGGRGRVALTVPRDRRSYVGDGDAAGMAKILGVRLTLAELVSGLLGERTVDSDYRVERIPRNTAGLPRSLAITGEAHRLSLRLKKKRPLRISTETLGNGAPPPGMETAPLDALEEPLLPEVTDEAGDG